MTKRIVAIRNFTSAPKNKLDVSLSLTFLIKLKHYSSYKSYYNFKRLSIYSLIFDYNEQCGI
jgi:hypothetical protein